MTTDNDGTNAGLVGLPRIVAARKKHVDAVNAYNARRELVLSERVRGNYDIKLDDEFVAMGVAQSEFIRVAQEVCDATLQAPQEAGESLHEAEARILQEYKWGNLTKLGVANHLRRAGFNHKVAIDKANALSLPEAQAVPEGWKPINVAPRDGRWVWLWNKHADRGYEAQRFRWSTDYSVFGLGGCWTDGYGSTMGDGVDFDFWRETLPADFVPPASPATGGA